MKNKSRKWYKYRGVQYFDRDLNSLKQNEIFAPTFKELNDPFECIYEESITNFINNIENIYNQNCNEIKEQLKELMDTKDNIGIYSLAPNYTNELLWAHYAYNSQGFCVEYNLDILKEKYLTQKTVNEILVKYEEKIPILNIEDVYNKDKFLQKLFATKSSAWKYEEEYRLIFDTTGVKRYHPSALTAIYFGKNMDKSRKQTLIKELSDKDMDFYDIENKHLSYKLERKLNYRNKRKLEYNINNYHFNIVKEQEEATVQNFYILYLGAKNKRAEFIKAFVEKYIRKNYNLFITNNKDAIKYLESGEHNKEQKEKYGIEEISQIDFDTHPFI